MNGARDKSGAAPQSSIFAVDNSLPGIREPHVTRGSPVLNLLADGTSAYRATLSVDEDAIYLLTDHVAHRIVPGEIHDQFPIENGSGAAVSRSRIVFWSQGTLWQIPKVGGKVSRVTALEHQPQFLMAAGEAIAWLDMKSRDEFRIQTFDGKKILTLVSHAGRIETATLFEGRVFFVARDDPTSWRIGSVSVLGGKVTYAAPKGGPTPAKIAVAGDVYYYDVQTNHLQKLSFDLEREETLATDFICSPVAVAVRVYCPNVEGMFELARHAGAKLMPLFPSSERITAVAASTRYLTWLNDAGPDRLSLRAIRLSLDDTP